MITPNVALHTDFVMPNDSTPEKQLFCAILLTFFEDIDHIKRMHEQFGPEIPQFKRYCTRYPFVELNSLVSEIQSEWVMVVCDYAEIDHEFLIDKVFAHIEKQLGRKFKRRKKLLENCFFADKY